MGILIHMQDSIAIYSILIISILVLYIAIKSKKLECPREVQEEQEKEYKPVKVSDIFKKMFSDNAPAPKHIALNVNTT